MKNLSRAVLAFGIALSVLSSVAYALPEWAEGLLKKPAALVSPSAKAVVLLDETSIDIKSDGSVKESRRYAVRILDRGAAHLASAAAWRLEKENKFSAGGAWLYRDGKRFRPDPTPEWVLSQPLDEDTAKSDSVRHSISYANHVLAGDVFIAEWSVTRTPLLRVTRHEWSSRGPIERDVLEYRLPPGWTLTVEAGDTQNLTVESNGTGGVWRWSKATPKGLAIEEDAPESDEVAAWLRLQITPAKAPPGKWLAFSNWNECGQWAEALNALQSDRNAELEKRAAALVAGSDGTRWGELQALAGFAQKISYVSIETGLGLGLGFQARKASQVLGRQLGDCKDKANLFRTLCEIRGFKVHLVMAQTEEINFDPTWAGPSQFNHAIAAVEVGSEIVGPAVVETSAYGRVLLFDATSETAYLGELPWYLYGKTGLIFGGGKSELITMPSPPDEQRYVYRHSAELTVGTTGGVEGKLVIVAEGATAQRARGRARDEKPEEIKKAFASRLSRAVKGVSVTDLKQIDGKESRSHRTEVGFKSENYAQAMPGGLMVLKLDVFGDRAVPAYPATTRERNLKRSPFTVMETVTVRLPEGFVVEEMPKDAKLEGEFGVYTSRWKREESSITVHREIFWKRTNLPPERYAEYKAFVSKVARANSSSVLVRGSR